MSNPYPSGEGPPPPPVPRNKGLLKLFVCGALLFGTLALYAPVRHYDFVNYDDDDYVAANPHVIGGLTTRNVLWAFTHFHAGNWHPLTWMSHMLDVQLWGLSPGAFHITNAILHAVNAVLLFLIVSRMTGAAWRSAFVAAAFAWHPVHVESVAWISERKDVLSAFFWMLTIGAYAHYVRGPGLGRYSLVLALFACGLLSKPMVVTLPFVLLLLDYWPLRRAGLTRQDTRKWLSLCYEKIPLFLLGAVFCAITIQSQKSFGAIKSAAEAPWHLRIANVAISYVGYLWSTVWPVNLAILYPFPSHVSIGLAAGRALLLLAVTALIVRGAMRFPPLVVGWLWYLGTLVPVIGLIQVGSQSMADRYLYLPSIGLLLVIAWGVPEFLKIFRFRTPLLAATAVISLVGCAAVSAKQIGYWRDSVSLYTHAFALAAINQKTHNTSVSPTLFDGLADAFLRAGKLTEADAVVSQARNQFPENGKRLNLAGLIKAQMHEPAEAEELWKQAIRLEPDWYQTYNNLGILYTNTGRLESARVNFEYLVNLRPDDVIALSNLAQVYLAEKNYEGARRSCERGLAVAPHDAVLERLMADIERQRAGE